MHLIYTYTQDPIGFQSNGSNRAGDYKIFNNLMKDLQVLKSKGPKKGSGYATDGYPLGVHPGLEDSKSEFANALKSIIKHYAKPQYLTNIAALSTNDEDGGDDWVMFIAEVDQKNPAELKLRPLNNVKTYEGREEGLVDFPLSFTFFLDDNIEHTYPRSEVPFTNNRMESFDAAKDSIIRVLDPKNTVLNVDCLSCHNVDHNLFQATIEAESKNKAKSQLMSIFNADYGFAPVEGITAFAHPAAQKTPTDRFEAIEDGKNVNFHNFGHIFGKATVSLRTVYESALVAAAFNEKFHGSPKGPGASCSSKGQWAFKNYSIIQKIADDFEYSKEMTCD